jgi:3,4-dihydroxy 2-butanone 4-phosphate synthase/GTP cyclohydrolase II
MVEAAGEGVVVYLRQEGRGIGLINKLKAYSLQDTGLDTVEANERLGFAADLRNYGVGAQILSDLGVQRLQLITNNPRKIAGLGGYGLQVEGRVPLVMDAGQHNAAYLQTKRTKLGHMMDGPQVVLAWHGQAGPLAWAAQLEQLRQLAAAENLSLEVEDHPRLLALMNQPTLAVLLGPSRDKTIEAIQIEKILATMACWEATQAVSLLLAPDGQRTSHPSVALEPSARGLAELGPISSNQSSPQGLQLEPGAFLVWR